MHPKKLTIPDIKNRKNGTPISVMTAYDYPWARLVDGAGIDMALWLTGQIWSPDLARATQKGMEYDPAPPYQAMV